jgi:hypothetical protein
MSTQSDALPVERQNLTVRMSMRRLTRLASGAAISRVRGEDAAAVEEERRRHRADGGADV